MKLTSADARKRWAEILRRSDRGETTEITVHGRVVAVVGPPVFVMHNAQPPSESGDCPSRSP